MSRLDKHKAQHKAAMSKRKVQSNPLEEIMRPVQPEPQCNPVDAREEGPVHYGSNGSAECGIVNPAVLSKDHRKVTCLNCRGYLPIVDAAYQAERKRPQNSPAAQVPRRLVTMDWPCGHCKKNSRLSFFQDDPSLPAVLVCEQCGLPLVSIKAEEVEGKRSAPAVRDERMRRKGRFPTATELHAKYLADLGGAGVWLVEVTVWTDQTGPSDGNAGKTFSQSGPGIHGCIESLWDQYCRWRDEQEAASTEGTLANWTTVELVGLAADPKNWSASAPEIKLSVLK